MFHNEALQLLDTIVAAAVEQVPLNAPPAAPVAGACYIVGAAPTGASAGHASEIAGYSEAGWRFVQPLEGMQAWIKSSATSAQYVAGQWELGQLRGSRVLVDGVQVVAGRAAAVPNPAGGTTMDSQARTAIVAILSAMRHHGLIATE